MVLSEMEGYLEGLNYDSNTGLTLTASWFPIDPYTEPQSIVFPWNRNMPINVCVDSLLRRKVRITVETVNE